VASVTLLGYSHITYIDIEVDEEQIYTQHFSWGLLVVFSAGCGLAAWKRWGIVKIYFSES
jgi:hypothetical protein